MPRQVPTPRTVEIPSAEAVAKERELSLIHISEPTRH